MAADTITRRSSPPEVRYEAKVDRSGGPDACHPWTASRYTATGYAVFHPVKGKTTTAHRWGFAHFIRPLDDDETVDHTCHNADLTCVGGRTCPHRACCNPAHWEATSTRANANRSPNSNAAKIVCLRGHHLSPENVRIHRPAKPGRASMRSCKTCARDREQQRARTPRKRDARGR